MQEESLQTSRQETSDRTGLRGVNRRNFVKTAATLAAVAATGPLEPLFGGKESVAEAANGNSSSTNRMNDCFNYRKNISQADKISVGPQAYNGDAARFTHFSCSYSKAPFHAIIVVP